MMRVLAAAWLVSAAAAIVFIASIAGDPAEIVFTWPTPSILIFSTAALVATMFSAAAVASVPLVWRSARDGHGWTRGRLLRFTLAAIVFAALGALLATWGALQPWNT